jgi:hypothetical protein
MSTQPPAYPVPFWIDRRDAPRLYRLEHVGDENVRGLRVTLSGPGHVVPVFVALMTPGASVTLTVLGVDLSRSSIAHVSWLRPDGDEYLWRFSF